MRAKNIVLPMVAAIVVCSGVGQATSYMMVADEDLADGASVIALVRVISRQVVEAGPSIFTDFLVEPRRVVKGEVLPRIRLRRLGGRLPSGRGLLVAGMPELEVGGDALVFLHERGDGTYGFKHLMLGTFRVRTVGDMRVAHRPGDSQVGLNLDDPRRQHRRASLLQAHMPRDLDRFMLWIADRAAGSSRRGDYYLDERVLTLAPIEKFNLIESAGGDFYHWHEFSPGVGGSISMVMDKKGLAGLGGKGTKPLKAVLKAWSRIFNIDMGFGGKKKAAAGFTKTDGFNTWLFGDPNKEIDGSFDCATGGVLAIGGLSSAFGPVHAASGSGGRRNYFDGAEGEVVFQDNIECAFARLGGRGVDDDFVAQIGAHEVGHMLGLDHSCGDDFSGPCNTTKKDEAIMRARLHSDGRAAAIKKDDKNGAKALDYKS